MNAATVANAVNKTMLIAPMIAVTTNTRAGVIRSVCPAAAASGAEVSVENVSLIFPQTSIDPSVRYRIPIAIIHTKNITIDTIRLIFSTVHGSTRLSCSDASRGGRRGALVRRALSALGRGGGPDGPDGRAGVAAPTCCGEAIGVATPGLLPDPDPEPEPSGADDVVEPDPDVAVTRTPRRQRPGRRRPDRPEPGRPCHRQPDRRRRSGRSPPGCRPRTGSSAALPWSAAWPCGP